MRLFRVKKRTEPLYWGSVLVFLTALAFSLGLACLALLVQGIPPLRAMALLWEGGFGHTWSLEDSLLKAIPIYLCALGVSFTFRMQIWNIGAEGQFALGAIGAAWAVLTFPTLPGYVLLPLMMLCSGAAGAAWALLPAWTKVRLGVNEIISTLMLNYIGILLLSYLVYGPWKDPRGMGFPMTMEYPAAAQIGMIGAGRLHWGLVLCVVLSILAWVFLNKTRLGYEIKASGESLRTARYAFMPYGFLVFLVMGICGMIVGWAGFVETSAVAHRLQPSVMVGYGYTAIVVAWVARLKIGPMALAAFLLAGLRVGVEVLQLELRVPAAFGFILEGLILLTVLSGQFFTTYTLRIERRTTN
ncbi:nucleoside ABC transporter membrane protein [Desulfonatronum thiosulfatophilum]|uniref:Nucleoside ABC transporter membrane protein n=1 Tax=Desulfonatronum thiosulfatophilum TaxID=617002 RepID=A0A1G6A9I2_9BACT|nr:ABC transporter permease [Desulfonatronum thiosulfatophilum]SDB04986.1 nucleoside ABC transporter membrane protein [Desulfonatronum thiosulfatophilum]